MTLYSTGRFLLGALLVFVGVSGVIVQETREPDNVAYGCGMRVVAVPLIALGLWVAS